MKAVLDPVSNLYALGYTFRAVLDSHKLLMATLLVKIVAERYQRSSIWSKQYDWPLNHLVLTLARPSSQHKRFNLSRFGHLQARACVACPARIRPLSASLQLSDL